jgi:hypothetical protein
MPALMLVPPKSTPTATFDTGDFMAEVNYEKFNRK